MQCLCPHFLSFESAKFDTNFISCGLAFLFDVKTSHTKLHTSSFFIFIYVFIIDFDSARSDKGKTPSRFRLATIFWTFPHLGRRCSSFNRCSSFLRIVEQSLYKQLSL